jgi:regulator of RNase E activity RraA
MALRMKTRGVKGCVVDGRVRDMEELKSCGLPVSIPRPSLFVSWMSTCIALFLRLL